MQSDNKELTVSSPTHVADTLALIERMAVNPAVDADKMGKLVDMQIKIMDKQAEIDFTQAVARMKPKLPQVEKNGTIMFTDKHGNERRTPHARYEDIQKAIEPYLAEEGFSLSFDTEFQPNQPTIIKCTLSHRGGHSVTKSLPLPLDTSGSKNNLQAMGSTISYGKRYLVGMMFDLVIKGEDDDGAGGPVTDEQAKEIKDGLRDTESDVSKFLAYMNAASVEEIRAQDYRKALNLIEAKRKKVKNANLS